MGEKALVFASIFAENLPVKEDWKFVYLKQRPLPPVEIKPQQSIECIQNVLGSLVAGYAMGGLLSLFLNMNDNYNPENTLSYKSQAKITFRNMGVKWHRQGKAFAVFGALLFSYECPIEKSRGVHDSLNGFIAGALVGTINSINRKARFRSILASGLGTGLFIGLIGLVME